MVGKDSREGQYNNISTRITDKQKDDVAAVDVVAAGNAPPPPSERKTPITDEVSEDLLLRKVREVFREQGLSYKRPTPKHVELAKQRVSEYGLQVFLIALNYWLEAPETVDELQIGAKEDGTFVLKSWVLFEYCRDGSSGLEAMEAAKRYRGKASGYALSFLIEENISPEGLTDDHFRAIQQLAADGGLVPIKAAYEREIEEGGSLTSFLINAREILRDGFRSVWEGYQPFAEALKAREPVKAGSRKDQLMKAKAVGGIQ
jgi:hypothetical protein